MIQFLGSDRGELFDVIKNLERCFLGREQNYEKQVEFMEDRKSFKGLGIWRKKKEGKYGEDLQEIIENYRSLVRI